jgi:5-methylcytosine-specific restriction endonuclease McrA
MAIKRTKWDVVFSDFIRYRDGWTCQRCGKKYTEKSQGLHCSHFYGRRSWATRIEPANAMALCFGCHQHVGSFPKDHVDLWESKFSEKEKAHVKELHNFTRDKLVKKSWIATDDNYKKLKSMLLKYTGNL